MNPAEVMQKTRQDLLSLPDDSPISLLENEWAKYKYLILAKDPRAYNAIRKLLKDKNAYPVREFFDLVDSAIAKEPNVGFEINAAQHVFGYFKNYATSDEKFRLIRLVFYLSTDKSRLREVKSTLFTLAKKYQQEYLLQSYYFNSIM